VNRDWRPDNSLRGLGIDTYRSFFTEALLVCSLPSGLLPRASTEDTLWGMAAIKRKLLVVSRTIAGFARGLGALVVVAWALVLLAGFALLVLQALL